MVAVADSLSYCQNIIGIWGSGLEVLWIYLVPASGGVLKISKV